jgi:hypothetical protein
MATPVCAEQLGRLFFTPLQRAQLETGNLQSDGSANHNSVTINGIVQRHGGARTAWINGVPKAAGASDERSPESLPLTLPGKSQPVRVKVGQKLLINPAATPDQ